MYNENKITMSFPSTPSRMVYVCSWLLALVLLLPLSEIVALQNPRCSPVISGTAIRKPNGYDRKTIKTLINECSVIIHQMSARRTAKKNRRHQREEKLEERIFNRITGTMIDMMPTIISSATRAVRLQTSESPMETESQDGEVMRTLCKQCGEYHPGWICYQNPEECFECGEMECKVHEYKNLGGEYSEFWNYQNGQQDSADETESQAKASEAAAAKELNDWCDAEEAKARNQLYDFADSDMTNNETSNYYFSCRETGHTVSNCDDMSGYSQYRKTMRAEASQNPQYDFHQQYQPLHGIEPTCKDCGKYHTGEVCLKATGRCFNCGEIGHHSRGCYAPRGTYKSKVIIPSTSSSQDPNTSWCDNCERYHEMAFDGDLEFI